MIHLELGYPSLYAFCVEHLHYSEGAAHRRISAMRMLREHPEIEAKIESGTLNVSTVSALRDFTRRQKIAPEAARKLLGRIEGQSRKECERLFAELAPEAPQPERERVTSPGQTEIRVTLPDETLKKLEKLKSLLSHRNPDLSYAALLETLAEIALAKLDPERKPTKARARGKRTTSLARSAQHKPATADQVETVTTPPRLTSPAIPKALRHEIWRRDQGRCTRCGSAYFLEYDHIVPQALAGPSDADNLRLLCRACNQFKAVQAFGARKMRGYLPGLRSR
jgi:hypothetical protein